MRMTWILSLVFVGGLLVAAPQAARGGDLTVRDVIELHRAGLGDEVLVALIEVDGGPFALSQPDVLDLKAEGLSDAVIAALVRAGRSRRSGANMWASQDDADTPPVADIDDAGTPVLTVPVAVPVYVPVPVPRRERGRHHEPPSHRVIIPDESYGDGQPPIESSLGPRQRPGAAGAARATPRGRRTSSVDAIRYAPPGFHPGVLGPRRPARTAAPSPDGAGASASESEPSRPSTPTRTPGIARSTADHEKPPPGVARSRPKSER